MSLESLIAYLSITLLVSASPGPMMINAMTDAAHYGLTKSSRGFIGASIGNLCLMMLSALGVALVLDRYPDIFNWIKGFGGIYLVYLGLRLWLLPKVEGVEQSNRGQTNLFIKGFLIAITNPKGIIYFGAFFPQFINPQEPLLFQYGLLAILFLTIDLIWMYIYAIFGQSLMRWMVAPSHRRWFNFLTGGFLVFAGVGLGFFS